MPDRQPKLAPVTATGRDVWLASGRDLVRRRSEESWLFADWIREGVEMMGSEAIGLVLEITGNSLGKIYDYLKVSTIYPHSKRLECLTFSHHLVAMRLPEDIRDRLLQAAADGRWPYVELREAVREQTMEAENAALKKKIEDLELALQAERMDPAQALDATRRLEGVVALYVKRQIREHRDVSRQVQEWRDGPVFRSLHGNARKAAMRRIVKQLTDTAARIEGMVEFEINPSLGSDQ